MWPIERAVEERLERFLEPRAERWLHTFFASPAGRQVLADIMAEFMVAWMAPSAGDEGILQDTVLRLVQRLADNPAFRQRLVQTLNPHWQNAEEPR
ncbi:MAG: hypothetical protein M0Z53_08810 [Thermaerobacter sp.]|nr:hypothetical protein [Thermaerobacter sp.]